MTMPAYVTKAGNSYCPGCGRTVVSHPIDADYPVLYILCDGSRVKAEKNGVKKEKDPRVQKPAPNRESKRI